MTTVEQRPAVAEPPPPPRTNAVLALLRNSWRQLTSMRTALVLLFLLAVAAIPGSVLPQRSVNREDVAGFFAEHPDLAPWLDRLGAFEVFASPWFSAIYLLLFTSLVGCVIPRLREHVRALRAVPPDAPRRLDRLPQHADGEQRDGDPATTAAAIGRALRTRRFRTAVREQPDGDWTVGAEKGYLKETGNLLFHIALLAVLVGVGFGSWYGWHGNRLLVAGADYAFCNTLQQYDESGLGPRVDGADLPAFCLELTDFRATYQPTGQPKSFLATVRVDERDGTPRAASFSVNSPLRLDDANVYLLGHGYAPVIRYTDRFGRAQTVAAPFLPTDGMMTSEGVAAFPDANVDPDTGRRDAGLQVAFEGLYLPTVPDTPPFIRSASPEQRAPGVMLWAYRGDLGLDTGATGSVYRLDRGQVNSGALAQVGEPKLVRPGEKWTLDDGTTVEFAGTREWITVSVRHDPTQPVVLAGAVAALAGLMLSLAGRRRRVWFRVSPAGSSPTGCSVEAGGLPRTDYPGFADEFAQLVAAVRDGGSPPSRDGDEHPERT
jgi:cytochrome c biogenesis protein